MNANDSGLLPLPFAFGAFVDVTTGVSATVVLFNGGHICRIGHGVDRLSSACIICPSVALVVRGVGARAVDARGIGVRGIGAGIFFKSFCLPDENANLTMYFFVSC